MLEVSSAAFKGDATIPAEYTCEGDDISPPLAWSAVPDGTRSIAILVEDPDAPKHTFTHWLVTDLPPTTTTLPRDARLPAGASAATNDLGDAGYGGPCPPPRSRHHYHFHVYALDTMIGPVENKAELAAKMRGHLLDEGELVATYERSGR
jgi:Raf kinase inhibitor-like YbhB/YbcL family protein